MNVFKKLINHLLGYPKSPEIAAAQERNEFLRAKDWYKEVEVSDTAIWNYVKNGNKILTKADLTAAKWQKMKEANTEEEFLMALKGNTTWDYARDYDYLVELICFFRCIQNKYVTHTEMMRYLQGEISLFEIRDRFDELSDAETDEEKQKVWKDYLFGF